MRNPDTPTPRRRAWMINTALLLVSTFLALGLVEALLRRLDRAELARGSGPATMDIMRNALVRPITAEEERAFRWDGKGDGLLHIRSRNRRMVYELRPNAHPNDLISTNADGFRDREFAREKRTGTFRILAVGDSISFGWYQRLEETYPKVLETLLNAQAAPGAAFEVYNMGIGGYNTEQEVALIQERAARYRPDLLLIQYCSNDGNIGVDAGLYDHFTRGKTRIGDALRRMWLRWQERDGGRMRIERGYRELAEYAAGQNVPVLVMMVPDQCDREARVSRDEAAIRRLGINVLPLADGFSAFSPEQLFRDCVHPNSLGHRVAAEEVLCALSIQPELRTAPLLRGPLPDFARARADLRQGLVLLEEGQMEEAVSLYRRAVSAVPAYNVPAACSLAHAAGKMRASGDFDKALRMANASLECDDGYAPAWLEKARALDVLGRKTEALEACQTSLDLWRARPGDTAPMATPEHALMEMHILVSEADPSVRGFVVAEEEDRCLRDASELYAAEAGAKTGSRSLLFGKDADPASEETAATMRDLEARYADCFLIQFNLALGYCKLHRWGDARRATKQTRALRPEDQSPALILKQTCLAESERLRNEGKLREASEAANQALEAVPGAYDAEAQVARIAVLLDDTETARRIYIRQIAENGMEMGPYAALEALYAGQGDWTGLREGLESVADRASGQPLFWLCLAKTCLRMRDFSAARTAAERALALDGANPEYRDLVMESCARFAEAFLLCNPEPTEQNTDEWIRARTAAERGFEVQPSHPMCRKLLSIMLAREARKSLASGDDKSCTARIELALRMNAGETEPLYALACLYEATGRMDLARDVYRECMAASPNDLSGYHELSRTYTEGDDAEGLVSEWRARVFVCPDCYLAHYSLGQALERTGAKMEARKAYARALELRPDAPDFLHLQESAGRN